MGKSSYLNIKISFILQFHLRFDSKASSVSSLDDPSLLLGFGEFQMEISVHGSCHVFSNENSAQGVRS